MAGGSQSVGDGSSALVGSVWSGRCGGSGLAAPGRELGSREPGAGSREPALPSRAAGGGGGSGKRSYPVALDLAGSDG